MERRADGAWLESDPYFGPAFRDVDEWRESPIRHRYVHGGFEGTTTRFEVHLPEPSSYRERMLVALGGGHGGVENGYATRGLPLAAAVGAFLVESNQGWRADEDEIPADPTVVAYRATAETARFAARLAEEMYGRPPRYRYLFGWSGGGNRAINVLENVPGLFHGAVGGGITEAQAGRVARSVVAWAGAKLADVAALIDDAIDVGGDGTELARLSAEQRDALAAAYRVGFPRGSEPMLGTPHIWMHAISGLHMGDPDFFDDFFGQPGHPGHDGGVERMRREAGVREIVEIPVAALPIEQQWPFMRPEDVVTGIRLDTRIEIGRFEGASARVVTGDRAGLVVPLAGIIDDIAVSPWFTADMLHPGDVIEVDNGRWLALQHFHRYAAERALRPAPSTVPYTGRFDGRLILLQTAQDHLAFVSHGARYADRVAEPSAFRIWWIDNADHGALPAPRFDARYVDWWGYGHRALSDLVAWVESGLEPAPSTVYRLDGEGILRLPPTARERRGVQPVVGLTADGEVRAVVRPGDTVLLRGVAEMPPGAGRILEVDWDADGTGSWMPGLCEPGDFVDVSIEHRYSEPGVYFPGLRVRARGGTASDDPDAMLANIGRARVVVER